MSRPRLHDLPCPASHKFDHLNHEVSCWGRVGHSGPHWSGRGLRWANSDDEVDER
jgi:hypothetical protein